MQDRKSNQSVRLSEQETSQLEEVAGKTGLKNPEIMRRAMRYALPLFLENPTLILDAGAKAEAAK